MNRRLALLTILFSTAALAERKDKMSNQKKYKVTMQRKQGVNTHQAPKASMSVPVKAQTSEMAKRLAEGMYHDYRALNAIPQ